MRKVFIRASIGIGVTVLVFLILFAALVIYLSVTEFRPKQTTELTVKSNRTDKIRTGQDTTLMTWNIGNAVLGDNADFFMDGGTHVKTSSKERMQQNLRGISDYIKTSSPDIMFIQEIDISSDRSYRENQEEILMKEVSGYSSSFAGNYVCRFVPFPLPPLGKMHSGIDTLSKYNVSSAVRESLPVPFSWPVRLANLKRCLLISRIPVEGSDKELVLINLHLEAYDDGEGKAAQTDMLRTLIEKERAKGNYVIAGGDFNQTFSDAANDSFPKIDGLWHAGQIDNSEFSSQWQMLMDEDTPSCRSLDRPFAGESRDHFQFYQIDGLIVSDNIEVKDYYVDDLNFVLSDHNPLHMTFSLKD